MTTDWPESAHLDEEILAVEAAKQGAFSRRGHPTIARAGDAHETHDVGRRRAEGSLGPWPWCARRVPHFDTQLDLSRLVDVGQLMTAINKGADQSPGAPHALKVGMLVDRCQSPELG